MDHPHQAPVWQSPVWLGVTAVLMFAMTIPMTRLATGSEMATALPPLFVAAGRGALAAVLALIHLWWVRAPAPERSVWWPLAGVVFGGVLAFPLCMGWAVSTLPAWHASVVTGVLPLVTAALAAWWLGHRPRAGFWWAGAAGLAWVLGFVALQASSMPTSVGTQAAAPADAILFLGLLGASVAYVSGARAAQTMPSAHVMSWALVLALPITLPVSIWTWHQELALRWQTVEAERWWALAYVAIGSSWLGFFAWYAALSRDAMRVSQLQLLQPFAALALSAWCLGEPVSPWAPLLALAVALSVWTGQRFLQPAAH